MNTESVEPREVTDLVAYKRLRSCERAIKHLTTVRDIKRDYLNKLAAFNQNRHWEYTKECNMLNTEIIQLEFEIGTFASQISQLQKQLTF